MTYLDFDGEHHNFQCAAEQGECFREPISPKRRQIPLDTGYFKEFLMTVTWCIKPLKFEKTLNVPLT